MNTDDFRVGELYQITQKDRGCRWLDQSEMEKGLYKISWDTDLIVLAYGIYLSHSKKTSLTNSYPKFLIGGYGIFYIDPHAHNIEKVSSSL